MSRKGGPVIGSFIDALDWDEAVARLLRWGESRESRVVNICNVHSVVTARRDPRFARALAEADMNTPDGAPVAWVLRRSGFRRQRRIDGPDLMLRYAAASRAASQSLYLYGGTPDTLEKLRANLVRDYPGLAIAGMHAPPFRPLTPEEDEADVARINASGAAVVFVGLGCPKQELWMQAHRGRVSAVMVGVGAAFDFHAGTVARAPHWMRSHGLEWLHRLASEPRRLWRRYLVSNTLFLWHAGLQIVRGRSHAR